MSDENKVRSWERLNDLTLLKKTDKSIFRYGGATIPQSMHGFFSAASMINEERREIQIRYDGRLYEAHLKKRGLVPWAGTDFLVQRIERSFCKCDKR